MTTPIQVCDALEDAGVRVEILPDGKARMLGGAQTAKLKAAVKEHRDAVLAEWQRRQDAPRGWGVLPQRLPLGHVAGPRDFPDTARMLLQRTILFEYCHRQGPQVRVWLEIRAREYWNEFAQGDVDSMIACEFTACLDLVAWQQRATWLEVLEKVQGLNEAAEHFTTTKPTILLNP